MKMGEYYGFVYERKIGRGTEVKGTESLLE